MGANVKGKPLLTKGGDQQLEVKNDVSTSYNVETVNLNRKMEEETESIQHGIEA